MKITREYLRSVILESLQEIEKPAVTPAPAPIQAPADVKALIDGVKAGAGKYASIILNDIMLAFQMRNQISKELAISALRLSLNSAKAQKQTKLEAAINTVLPAIRQINFTTKDINAFNNVINKAIGDLPIMMENLEEMQNGSEMVTLDYKQLMQHLSAMNVSLSKKDLRKLASDLVALKKFITK